MSELQKRLTEAAAAIAAAQQRADSAEAAADELRQQLGAADNRAEHWQQEGAELSAQVGREGCSNDCTGQWKHLVASI